MLSIILSDSDISESLFLFLNEMQFRQDFKQIKSFGEIT